MGPCSHWSRQPDLLMRTFSPSPAALVSCCNLVYRSLVPLDVQEGRGEPSGRELWHTKTWCSNKGKWNPSRFSMHTRSNPPASRSKVSTLISHQAGSI